jgi:ankyrin repeat protein
VFVKRCGEVQVHKRKIAVILAIGLFVLTTFCPVSYAQDQGQALIEAARNGDLSQVKALLDKGAYVKAHDFRWTALMEASGSGHLDVVKLLIDKGADVNDVVDQCGGKRGGTALMAAVWTGHARVVQFLLEKGAEVNESEILGITVLGVAHLRNHNQVVELLRAYGFERLGPGYPKNGEYIARSKNSPISLEQVQALVQQGAARCAEAPHR